MYDTDLAISLLLPPLLPIPYWVSVPVIMSPLLPTFHSPFSSPLYRYMVLGRLGKSLLQIRSIRNNWKKRDRKLKGNMNAIGSSWRRKANAEDDWRQNMNTNDGNSRRITNANDDN
jgi:hypothetical protein